MEKTLDLKLSLRRHLHTLSRTLAEMHVQLHNIKGAPKIWVWKKSDMARDPGRIYLHHVAMEYLNENTTFSAASASEQDLRLLHWDLGPQHIILKEGSLQSPFVIDWETAYTGSVQMAHVQAAYTAVDMASKSSKAFSLRLRGKVEFSEACNLFMENLDLVHQCHEAELFVQAFIESFPVDYGNAVITQLAHAVKISKLTISPDFRVAAQRLPLWIHQLDAMVKFGSLKTGCQCRLW